MIFGKSSSSRWVAGHWKLSFMEVVQAPNLTVKEIFAISCQVHDVIHGTVLFSWFWPGQDLFLLLTEGGMARTWRLFYTTSCQCSGIAEGRESFLGRRGSFGLSKYRWGNTGSKKSHVNLVHFVIYSVAIAINFLISLLFSANYSVFSLWSCLFCLQFILRGGVGGREQVAHGFQ